MSDSIDQQLKSLPTWAKSISEFGELDLDDQVTLLRTSESIFDYLGVLRIKIKM